MKRLTELLSKRVYGIPVGVIAAIVAAVALYGVIRFVPKAEEPREEDVQGDPDLLQADGYSAFVATSPVSSFTQYEQPTNETWIRRAVQFLVGKQVRPDYAQIALQKGLAGDTMSYQENQYWTDAIREFGVPPTLSNEISQVLPRPDDASLPAMKNLRVSRQFEGGTIVRWDDVENVSGVETEVTVNGKIVQPMTAELNVVKHKTVSAPREAGIRVRARHWRGGGFRGPWSELNWRQEL